MSSGKKKYVWRPKRAPLPPCFGCGDLCGDALADGDGDDDDAADDSD